MTLPARLKEIKDRIEAHAKSRGLDFFETIFEIVDWKQMNEIAAYGGFPTRYPHWRFGMQYEQISKSYAYGLSKIYEMVINNDPCYAYLLHGNKLVDQKLVMAHVYGHCDFFKNNSWFSHTNRKMMDEMANHGTRVEKYIDQYGVDAVENWIDTCLSLENLIDYHAPQIRRERPSDRDPRDVADERTVIAQKLRATNEYMEEYINPPSFVEAQRERAQKERERLTKFPPEPEKDVLKFLMEHAPLANWKRDILSIIREEAYYFAPQGQTKIMNEGWAVYWHSEIMKSVLDDSELIDYADHHSGTLYMQPGSLNPYKLGVELFRHIEDRWNKGKFGKEYEECDDYETKRNWNRQIGLGRNKIFDIRRIYNDVMFIDEFLTEDFCREQKLFVYHYNKNNDRMEIQSRQFGVIKKKLLFQLTNFGQPRIFVEDANHSNRGELFLSHYHDGIDLQLDYARETLHRVQMIWTRPVHIVTLLDEKKYLVSFDGKEIKEQYISES